MTAHYSFPAFLSNCIKLVQMHILTRIENINELCFCKSNDFNIIIVLLFVTVSQFIFELLFFLLVVAAIVCPNKCYLLTYLLTYLLCSLEKGDITAEI
jgi:hypothetical protein